MKLAFHFLGAARVEDEHLWIKGQFGGFVDALARNVDHIDLLLSPASRRESTENKTDYQLAAQNVSWVSIGPANRQLDILPRMAAGRSAIRSGKAQWDIVLFREPSRRAPFLYFWLGDTPKAFLLGADFISNLGSANPLMTRARARLFTQSLRWAMRDSLVFVNNEFLLEKWQAFAGDIHLTRTTTLFASDIAAPPTDYAAQPPYHLLFVGRIHPAKGLEYLLRALAALSQYGERYHLTLVGAGDSTYLQQLQAEAESLQIADQIEWAGYQPITAIWDFYRKADIFVSPAISEDIARTNWEAMSQGCPVITTPVGGQKYVFTNEQDVLFTEPANSDDLAEKIRRLSHDTALRQRMIDNGLRLAAENTLERRAREMTDLMNRYLSKRI